MHRLAFLGVLCAFVPMACVEPEPLPDGPIQHGQVADVPVPSGFVFVKDRAKSYYFESGSFRDGRLEYHGDLESIAAGLEFFRARLPEHGWVNATASADDTLRLTKGSYSLELTISPIGPGENRGYPYKTVAIIRTAGQDPRDR